MLSNILIPTQNHHTQSLNFFHMYWRTDAFNNWNCFLLSERQELNATFCWTFFETTNGSFFLLYPARLPLLFPATQIEFYQPERIFLLNEAQYCNNLKGIFRQRSKNVWFVIACWTLAQSVAIRYLPSTGKQSFLVPNFSASLPPPLLEGMDRKSEGGVSPALRVLAVTS